MFRNATKNVTHLCAIPLILLTPALASQAAGPQSPVRGVPQTQGVEEAVFRYLMQHYPLDKDYRLYFLGTPSGDPPPAFLRRFGTVPVLPVSRMRSGMHMGYEALVDNRTGQKGWYFAVNRLRWHGDAADVDGCWMNVTSGGNIDQFRVVRSRGGWRVTRAVTTAQM